jgi:hypothetical protein
VRVPGERADPLAALDPEPLENSTEPQAALRRLAPRRTATPDGDDLARTPLARRRLNTSGSVSGMSCISPFILTGSNHLI